ncbi:MAG TPA: hypothetical protein VKY85_13150 [Candidatus Angelobacter sp.]|nr:hypothetical protein [Candidatus Angelobacter sp.]
MKAASEEAAQSGALAAGASADGSVAFVEQESGDRLGRHGQGQIGGLEAAGSEGGAFTEEGEQLQAKGLAGLLVGRADGEVRGDLGRGETVGVEDPEGEDGTLVLGTLEIATDEFTHL